MNTLKFLKRFSFIFLLSIIFSNFILTSCSTDDNNETEEVLPTLSQEEKDMIVHMREEEKLARDVYDYLYNQTGIITFANIVNSEQMHMDKVLELLQEYNIQDPALPTPGEFSSQEMQELYDQLIVAGSVSDVEAIKVGLLVEDLDIYDLEELSAKTENVDILSVFGFLECGSRNHLRAFYNDLLLLEGTYTPQFISQTEYDEIINNSYEMCY